MKISSSPPSLFASSLSFSICVKTLCGRSFFLSLKKVPFERHFREADVICNSTQLLFKKYQLELDDPFSKKLWSFMRTVVTKIKTRAALPVNLEDLETVANIGTARLSLPNFQRSSSWFRKNGQCVDNIKPGPSTIPHAGRGAFAVRPLRHGSVISPMPMLHIPDKNVFTINNPIQFHHDTETYYHDFDPDPNVYSSNATTHQLLLNYCYGHINSSAVFFTYAPGVNYINHASSGKHQKANAFVRWIKTQSPLSKYHQSHWLQNTVRFLKRQPKVGLMMELVALRDINAGEEILMDYGADWDRSYTQHVQTWNHVSSRTNAYVPAFILNRDSNSTIRTVLEQKTNPYPPNIQTFCFYSFDEGPINLDAKWNETARELSLRDVISENRSVSELKKMSFNWIESDGLYDNYDDNFFACKILLRSAVDTNGQEIHTLYNVLLYHQSYDDGAKIPQSVEDTRARVVSEVPRRAIRFVDKEYTSDMHNRKSFRHLISFPDGIFPKKWMDLK
mmetsp:Transcript_53045/g.63922  ORF Transcript_53045/g.63922 Transcript_53045/m.63922 type:complete len:506 (-) Transcript_53045:27-1544(-)